MTETLQNILTIIAAGIGLVFLVFILRGVLKTVWKVARVLLILLAIMVIAGYFLGYLELSIR